MGLLLLGLSILSLSFFFIPPVKGGVVLGGVLIMALSYFFPSPRSIEKIPYYEKQSLACRHFVIEWTILMGIVFGALLWTVKMGSDVAERTSEIYQILSARNGVWETLQFVALLLSGLLLVYGSFRYRSTFAYPVSIVFPLFFALVFLIGAGEEARWSLPWKDPGEKDTTLRWLSFTGFELNQLANQLVKAIVILYAGLLPLFAFCFRSVKLLMEQLSIPLPHAAFVPFCLMGVALDHPWVFKDLLGIGAYPPHYDMTEFRETLMAFTVLGGVLFSLKKWKWRLIHKQ